MDISEKTLSKIDHIKAAELLKCISPRNSLDEEEEGYKNRRGLHFLVWNILTQ